MTPEQAKQKLQMVLECHNKGIPPFPSLELALYELAACFEPAEYLAMLPESLRLELSKIASSPLMRREDWTTIEGVCVHPSRVKSYQRDKQAREERQYEGISKLHKYFTDHNDVVAS